MNIQLRAKNIKSNGALQRFVSRRLDPILERYADRIDWVRVTFQDVNGPKGGEDILCRAQVALSGATVVVEAFGVDPFQAVSRTMARLRLKLSSRFERLRNRRRQASRPQPA